MKAGKPWLGAISALEASQIAEMHFGDHYVERGTGKHLASKWEFVPKAIAEWSEHTERKRIIAKARERASRFPYFPHGDALRNFANELEREGE